MLCRGPCRMPGKQEGSGRSCVGRSQKKWRLSSILKPLRGSVHGDPRKPDMRRAY